MLLVGGGHDEDDVAEQIEGRLSESLVDSDTGISLLYPGDWTRLERGDKFAFQSPDKTVLLSISAPAPASAAPRVRKDAIAATTERYRNPMVGRGGGRRVGGLESAGAVISGRGPGGPSRTLVAVSRGEAKTYVLEVYSTSGAAEPSLADAQLILNSLELSK